jgi:hypothetical protein
MEHLVFRSKKVMEVSLSLRLTTPSVRYGMDGNRKTSLSFF